MRLIDADELIKVFDRDEANLYESAEKCTIRGLLNEEPVECFVHNRVARRNGKEFFDTVVCTRDADCPDCENGDRAT